MTKYDKSDAEMLKRCILAFLWKQESIDCSKHSSRRNTSVPQPVGCKLYPVDVNFELFRHLPCVCSLSTISLIMPVVLSFRSLPLTNKTKILRLPRNLIPLKQSFSPQLKTQGGNYALEIPNFIELTERDDHGYLRIANEFRTCSIMTMDKEWRL